MLGAQGDGPVTEMKDLTDAGNYVQSVVGPIDLGPQTQFATGLTLYLRSSRAFERGIGLASGPADFTLERRLCPGAGEDAVARAA